ncbi:MAG: DUF4118 domain-containing protein, partial [Proteobacteria bacterium]|nr:DUF4118 domain-containing protein [Pseudomonadota bacterium]
VVVDLPPEDLIQRVREGKVYLPDNAQRAIDKFFKASNLTALRELALRRTADRVDVQMLAQLRQQGIEGPWPTAERILVCVGIDPTSEAVIRTAGRLATAQKADLVALHINRGDREGSNRKTSRRIERMMRLAQRLGASTARLNGRDLSAEILGYARRNNITQIIIGRSRPTLVDRMRGRNLSRNLIDRASGLSVLVVAPEGAEAPARSFEWPTSDRLTKSLLSAMFAVIAATGVGSVLERLTPLPNLSMVFLLAVLLCALQFGLASALSASAFSFLAYNFFFIDPRYTFTVAEPYELLSLFIFLIVAFVTGSLAGRLKQQSEATRERAEATQALLDFSRKLSAAPKLDDVLWLLTNQAAASVKGQAVVLLDQGQGGLAVAQLWPPGDHLSTSDWAAARWSHQRQEPAGRGTTTMPTARFHFRAI